MTMMIRTGFISTMNEPWKIKSSQLAINLGHQQTKLLKTFAMSTAYHGERTLHWERELQVSFIQHTKSMDMLHQCRADGIDESMIRSLAIKQKLKENYNELMHLPMIKIGDTAMIEGIQDFLRRK